MIHMNYALQLSKIISQNQLSISRLAVESSGLVVVSARIIHIYYLN